MRNSDSYTAFGGKQTPQETLMHPPAAAAAGEVCSAGRSSTHGIFVPTCDYKVVQESSRCSAEGV